MKMELRTKQGLEQREVLVRGSRETPDNFYLNVMRCRGLHEAQRSPNVTGSLN